MLVINSKKKNLLSKQTHMRILFLAPNNYDYTKAIAKEMELQGHEITCLEDKTFGIDYFLSYHNKLKRWAKFLLGRSSKKKKKYWQICFFDNADLKEPFDMLLCINGYSLCEEFFRLLKATSPNVRTIYYLWDSCSLYAFNKNFCYFDKCTTFDWVDAQKYRIYYLPMFWIPTNIEPSADTSVFFVGTIHSDRYYVLKTIKLQLERLRIPYYIKLYIPPKHGLLFALSHFIEKLTGIHSVNSDIYEIMHHKLPCDFAIHKHISLSEFNTKMAQATHIIDIEQPCQTAITPRVIQALAEKKKIISTNKWLKESGFYTTSQICIIDRNSPQITEDFFDKSSDADTLPNGISELRIDNWCKSIITKI